MRKAASRERRPFRERASGSVGGEADEDTIAWFNILVDEGYVTAPDSTNRGLATNSVFYCPSGNAGFSAALRAAEAAGEPVVLLGTAFGLIHWLDSFPNECFRLAPGSG